ncbi:MAG: RND transporter, partial [Myxococcales bacterium]|nr:RND transporter [Myxococcales bacterium]
MDPQPPADYIETLNRMFERLGGWSFDRRNRVLAACLVLLVAAFYFAGSARFDASFEAYFDTDDPTYVAYNRFRADFGSDEIAYILYSVPDSEHGPFDLEVMRKIEQLTEALEGVPFVSKVTSLANAEYMYGVPGGLEIEEILKNFPESQQEML